MTDPRPPDDGESLFDSLPPRHACWDDDCRTSGACQDVGRCYGVRSAQPGDPLPPAGFAGATMVGFEVVTGPGLADALFDPAAHRQGRSAPTVAEEAPRPADGDTGTNAATPADHHQERTAP